MKKKKIFYLVILFFFITLISGLFIFNSFFTSPYSENTIKKLAKQGEYKVYKNDYYNYEVLYPGTLKLDKYDYPSGVSFRNKFDYWQMGIKITQTNYSNIDNWSKNYIKEREKEDFIVKAEKEKEVYIDGNKGVLFKTTYPDNYEVMHDDTKRLFYIKDGYLYRLTTRQVDHEKIWKSFKFIK